MTGPEHALSTSSMQPQIHEAPAHHIPSHNSKIATLVSMSSTPLTFWIPGRKHAIKSVVANVKRLKFMSAHKSTISPAASLGADHSPSNSDSLNALSVPLSNRSAPLFRMPRTPRPSLESNFGDFQSFPTDAQRRRQKMDKVARIFGESIPPRLVFPSLPPEVLTLEFITDVREDPDVVLKGKGKEAKTTPLQSTSYSVSTLSPYTPISSRTTVPRPSTAPHPQLQSAHFSSAPMLARSATYRAQSHRKKSEIPVSSSNATRTRKRRSYNVPRPSTASRLETSSVPLQPSTTSMPPVDSKQPIYFHSPSSSESNLVATSPIEGAGGFAGVLVASPRSPEKQNAHRSITRKETLQGWSGEWNQRDMQQVIRKLRSLK
jgi:hypothetical protein